MHFVLQTPSLQHIAAIKTVAALWNHHAILTQLAEQSDDAMEQVWIKWGGIAEKVKANALALDLIEPCKKQLVNFIAPLHVEIYKWCCYHYTHRNEKDDRIYLKCSLPKQFCWTMHGVVDYAKTAQLMVKDERLTVERRYEIVCKNCLEDEARKLIKFIPESRLQEYSTRPIIDSRIDHQYLMNFFTCTLRGDVDQLNVSFQQVLAQGASINRYLFFRALQSGNRATCAFFFNKLNQREKEWVLKEGAMGALNISKSFSSLSVFYYLSLMNEKQRRHVFRECTRYVLLCLLRWPLQSLFVEAAERGRDYMEPHDHEAVLSAIAHVIGSDGQDYNYSQLFLQFFFLDNVEILEILLETEKEEIFNLNYNEAPLPQLLAWCNRILEKMQASLQNLNEERRQEIDIVMESRMKRRRLL